MIHTDVHIRLPDGDTLLCGEMVREHHARKIRLMEVLDGLDAKTIIKKRR